MKLRTLIVAATLASVAGTAMAADKKIVTDEGVATFSFFKPASVRAEVGTLGYGGAVSYNATPKVGVTLGYNGGDISWSDGFNALGADYDLSMKNNNVYLNAELRPFANPFYIAAGVGYIDAEYSINETATDENSVIRKLGGRNYTSLSATELGSVDGKISYDNTIAPYLGLGFSPSTTSRVGLFGEVGAYYTGSPDATITATNLKLVGGSTAVEGTQAAEEQENRFKNDDRYKWLPVAKLGVTYRF